MYNNDVMTRMEELEDMILKILEESSGPITGQELADRLGVTRQTIVQHIALLRSRGHEIVSTPRGYIMSRSSKGFRRLIAVKHGMEDIREELTTIVKNGGRILDVIVEHPLYGEIRGNLNISTMDDVEKFIASMEASEAVPLLTLSRGIHLHTIEADDRETLEKVVKALEEKDILLGKEERE